MSERILIVDDDDSDRGSLELVLATAGYEIVTASCAEEALEHLEDAPVDVVLTDLRMPGLEGMDLLPQITRRMPGVPVVLMSGCGTEELAVEATRRGAYAYLTKPIDSGEFLLTLDKARERERLRRANQMLQRDVQRAVGDRPIIAASPSMIDLLELMERAACFKTTALLTGESGTGKEVLARAIHSQSPRHAAAFVAVNCGATPENHLEAELFGHSKGAFTGADRAQRGLLAEADGGTLFLDDIGKLSPTLQVKLLQVLQEEEIRPVGESKARKVDVRVLAATSRDLEEAVASGGFREDLFYRLNVVRIPVPALRERREDIPLLADHFLAHFRNTLGSPVRMIAEDALERITAYRWPGNVRELENVVERALILCDSDRLTVDDLPADVVAAPQAGDASSSSGLSLKRARRAVEVQTIRRALRATGGNRTRAAVLLEISHRALLYKLKEYGIRD